MTVDELLEFLEPFRGSGRQVLIIDNDTSDLLKLQSLELEVVRKIITKTYLTGEYWYAWDVKPSISEQFADPEEAIVLS